MFVRIDKASGDPLYLQIRSQIIEAIARGELLPDASLPSVRTLANDLGINLHTVNKAYAVLRDEGYITMRGRSGARIADPTDDRLVNKAQHAMHKMLEDMYTLALAHRARGGSKEEFITMAQQQANQAFKGD